MKISINLYIKLIDDLITYKIGYYISTTIIIIINITLLNSSVNS